VTTSSEAVGLAVRTPGTLAVGIVLTLSMTAASVFQYVLGALAPQFRMDLHLSRAALGALTTAYYLVASTASALLGRRIGMLGSRAGLFLLFGMGGAACVLVAAVGQVWAVAVGAGVAGTAAGLSNPVTNMVIAGRPGAHGALVGMKQAGVQMAAVVVGLGIPALSAAFGWRGALAWFAGIMFAAGLLAAARMPTASSTGPAPHNRGVLPPALRWLRGYAFFMGAGMATFNTYLVLYSRDHVGVGMTTAGLLLGTFGAAGAGARFVTSVLAERGRRLEAWMTVGGFVAVAGVALFALSTDLRLVWAGVAVVGLSGAAWNGVVMLAVLRISGPGQEGHATGAVLAGFFLGLAVAPPAFGALVDATHSYGPGWTLAGGCFATAGALMLVASCRTRREGTTTHDEVVRAPVPPV
jgi:predicted MFS family arabinose efflux permease